MSRSRRAFSWMRRWLPVLSGALALIGTVAGGLWTASVYLTQKIELEKQATADQQKLNITRLIEAQRPFIERAMRVYFETVNITGQLVVLAEAAKDFKTPEWDAVERQFWIKERGELGMVLGGCAEATYFFAERLKLFKKEPTEENALRLRVRGERLVQEFQITIRDWWKVGLNKDDTPGATDPTAANECGSGTDIDDDGPENANTEKTNEESGKD